MDPPCASMVSLSRPPTLDWAKATGSPLFSLFSDLRPRCIHYVLSPSYKLTPKSLKKSAFFLEMFFFHEKYWNLAIIERVRGIWNTSGHSFSSTVGMWLLYQHEKACNKDKHENGGRICVPICIFYLKLLCQRLFPLFRSCDRVWTVCSIFPEGEPKKGQVVFIDFQWCPWDFCFPLFPLTLHAAKSPSYFQSTDETYTYYCTLWDLHCCPIRR